MPAYAPDLDRILSREPEPAGGTISSDVDYTVGGTPCRGYLAAPAGPAGPVPGVLVVHDWLGVTDSVRMRCDMLARLGYAAFAADIYGADVRPSDAEAARVAGAYYGDQGLWRQRVVGAFDRMREEAVVDRARTAAIGYCFGGSTALQLARTGADLRGVVSFHGALATGPEGEAEGIRAALLVLTGAIDPVVPAEDVQALEAELGRVPGLDWTVVTYSGAMHAFSVPEANAPDHGARFDPRAEARSWIAMKDFFAEVL
ncbi:dienelactone hydrolase family protein [Amnibacterium sp.]|uniref:dienelactone hydrolase family protein n=1 Tax=Amnibacterium sp. TaxID=1872496 RepID=UPI00260A4A96|nr:dienelactone hydrolase family protein [Amnibacterium sp.]MCU1472333.1 dienelactone hydrolase [Amnibacterium sp.]